MIGFVDVDFSSLTIWLECEQKQKKNKNFRSVDDQVHDNDEQKGQVKAMIEIFKTHSLIFNNSSNKLNI